MAFLVELATVTGKPAILTTETTQPAGFAPGLSPTRAIPGPRSTLMAGSGRHRAGDDTWLLPTRPGGHRPWGLGNVPACLVRPRLLPVCCPTTWCQATEPRGRVLGPNLTCGFWWWARQGLNL
jgi:hypothetical protein